MFTLIDITGAARLQIIFDLGFDPIIIKGNPLHARLDYVYRRLRAKVDDRLIILEVLEVLYVELRFECSPKQPLSRPQFY